MRPRFGQFCPVAIASEIVGERWTPIILRELLAGADHFNALHRGIPRISRPLLAKRLRDLEKAGVIGTEPLPGGRGSRYRLTDAGRELSSVVDALGAWGQRWTARVRRDTLDARFLMWNMRRRIALDRLPARRIVVRFHFTAVPAAQRAHTMFWLLLEPTQADLCVEDPGYEVDLYVEADLAAMALVWLGETTVQHAITRGSLRLSGPRELTRAFPTWLMLSRFAAVPRRSEPPSPA
jgi:DNA-binding HxlR family transcriptional regulator